MKKYHKIRGVPLDVCSAEQKIAYNIAFYGHVNLGDVYNDALKVSKEKADKILNDIVEIEFGAWMRTYSARNNYNDDAIKDCLIFGLADYLVKPFIASDYETVGRAFPKGADK